MIKSKAKVSAMRWIISLFGAAGLTAALALVMIQLIAVSDERGGRELVGYVPEPSSNDCLNYLNTIIDLNIPDISVPTPHVLLSPEIANLFEAYNTDRAIECGRRSGLGDLSSTAYSCPVSLQVEEGRLQVQSIANFCLNEKDEAALGWYLRCIAEGEAIQPAPPQHIEGQVTIFHVFEGPWDDERELELWREALGEAIGVDC